MVMIDEQNIRNPTHFTSKTPHNKFSFEKLRIFQFNKQNAIRKIQDSPKQKTKPSKIQSKHLTPQNPHATNAAQYRVTHRGYI